MTEGRKLKGVSFTEEYEEEYNKLLKESNASKLICELLRNHYQKTYGSSELECDIKHLRTDISYIKRKLERIGIV
jgi:cytoplasmic iron level regulating protein YaaA (DUF328/UPF0246 family)